MFSGMKKKVQAENARAGHGPLGSSTLPASSVTVGGLEQPAADPAVAEAAVVAAVSSSSSSAAAAGVAEGSGLASARGTPERAAEVVADGGGSATPATPATPAAAEAGTPTTGTPTTGTPTTTPSGGTRGAGGGMFSGLRKKMAERVAAATDAIGSDVAPASSPGASPSQAATAEQWVTWRLLLSVRLGDFTTAADCLSVRPSMLC